MTLKTLKTVTYTCQGQSNLCKTFESETSEGFNHTCLFPFLPDPVSHPPPPMTQASRSETRR